LRAVGALSAVAWAPPLTDRPDEAGELTRDGGHRNDDQLAPCQAGKALAQAMVSLTAIASTFGGTATLLR
jgi:hypothetical protein